MKKIFIILLMIISFAGYSQTRKSFFEVPDTATNFVYTMPIGSIIFEVDSLKFYRLTAKFTGSDNMKDVFTAGSYEVVSAQDVDDFTNGGETGGADRTLGNTDEFAMGFLTYGRERTRIQADGSKWHQNGYFQYFPFFPARTLDYVVIKQVNHNTTDWHELFIDDISEQMIITQAMAWTFDIQVTGISSHANESFHYQILGAIKRVGNITTLLNSSITTIYKSTSTFNIRVSADDTNEALIIEVQDSAGSVDNSIVWVASVRINEIFCVFP